MNAPFNLEAGRFPIILTAEAKRTVMPICEVIDGDLDDEEPLCNI